MLRTVRKASQRTLFFSKIPSQGKNSFYSLYVFCAKVEVCVPLTHTPHHRTPTFMYLQALTYTYFCCATHTCCMTICVCLFVYVLCGSISNTHSFIHSFTHLLWDPHGMCVCMCLSVCCVSFSYTPTCIHSFTLLLCEPHLLCVCMCLSVCMCALHLSLCMYEGVCSSVLTLKHT